MPAAPPAPRAGRPLPSLGRRVAGLAVLGAAAAWGPGVLGEIGTVFWLVILPGVALARWLVPGGGRWTVLSLGLALGPLVASVIAVAALLGGAGWPLAVLLVVVAGLSDLIPAGSLRTEPQAGRSRIPGSVVLLATALAVFVLLPPLLNRYVAVRGDSWTHAGIAWELRLRGVPPQDPHFVGHGLSYVWFYDLVIALLTVPRGQDPFHFMALLNATTAFATVAVAALCALELWRRRSIALGSALLTVLGLNAVGWLLWPLGLARAFVGQVRGMSEVVRLLRESGFGTTRVVYALHAPFSLMLSFLDKLLIGTAVGYGYLLMLVLVWTVLRRMRSGGGRELALAALASAGLLLFHGVVGLSVIPVTLAALAGLVLLAGRWGSSAPAIRRRAAATGAAIAAGLLLGAPYTWMVSHDWVHTGRAGSTTRIDFVGAMPWTLATACAVPLLLIALTPLRRRLLSRPAVALTTLLALGLVLFSLVVDLPQTNEAKFVFECFVPLTLLAAPAFLPWARRVSARGAWAGIGLAVVFLGPPALTFQGFLADPSGATAPELDARPAARRVYAWIREHTPVEAAFVDPGPADVMIVRGRRALVLPSPQAPDLAFPPAEMAARRRVVTDLYGPCERIGQDVRALERLGRPVALLVRPSPGGGRAAAAAWLAHPEWFREAHRDDGFRVVELVPTWPASGAHGAPVR